MTEIRRGLIADEPVILAPDRASRFPESGCPFCPGHESETPPELARAGDPWRIRVFDNKYPFAPRHEVIVESPTHDAAFGRLENTREIVAMYAARYRSIDMPHVVLFKNHGAMAGASLEHLHSQIAGIPFIPPRAQRELAVFATRCPLCDLEGPAESLHYAGCRTSSQLVHPPRPPHVIDESPHFLRIAPHGSSFAYEQWIVPKRHTPNFSTMSDDETDDLAERLRDAARSMERIAPSYNWLFMNFQQAGHWYVQAMPRMTTIAGFELATGTFVDIIDPAAAAKALRI